MFRVIVHRGQARSYRRAPKPVGAVLARDLGDSVPQTHRVIVHREQGGAPPRSLLQRSRSSVGAGLAREPGDAVYQTFRVYVHRGQARSYRRAPKPVGAVLARDLGNAVYQAHRVIVHREQGGAPPRSLLQVECDLCGSGACPRYGRRGLPGLPLHSSSRASAPMDQWLRHNAAPLRIWPINTCLS